MIYNISMVKRMGGYLVDQIYGLVNTAFSAFLKAYYTSSDVDSILRYFHDSVLWVGTVSSEVAYSKEELRLLLERKFAQTHYTTKFEIKSTHTDYVTDELVTLYADVVLSMSRGESAAVDLSGRITIAYMLEDREWLISLMHVSTTSRYHLENGQTHSDYAHEKNRMLQSILQEKSYELESTYSSIPGGVLRAQMDSKMTILYCNDTYLKMTGYTRHEIDTVFSGSVFHLIHEEDRADTVASMKAQLKSTGKAQLEYKLNTKDGQPVWVLEQGQLVTNSFGESEFFSVVLDVTDDHKNRESLRISEERYHIILDQIDDILCEWDISTDIIVYSPNFEKTFGYMPDGEGFSMGKGLASHVHPSDLRFLREFIADTLHNTAPSAVEARIQTITGRYIWMRIRASAVRNEFGIPKRVVGMMTNINTQRLTLEDLRTKSQRDLLTELYNKITAQQMVEEKLIATADKVSHALMIVDIDNFKAINDTMGHMFGDTVLTDVATKLKALFRSSDVLGRVGGDEFIIFLSNISVDTTISRKATDITDIFRNSYVKDGISYKISCSIGIAVSPNHGTTFADLYHNADRALYAAKSLGKDRYLVYNDDLAQSSPDSSSAVGAIDNLLTTAFSGNSNDLNSLVFNELYESNNLRSSLDWVLGMIGEHLAVSRAYIFEISENGLTASNTFEWCSEGIEPCSASLQNVELVKFSGYFQNYNDSGVFSCDNVSELDNGLSDFLKEQGILATLQVYITDGGRIKGFIGFDDCQRTRSWSRAEINFLIYISKVVGLFVVKRVASEELAYSHKNQMSILNGINAFTYVINPIDYSLLYINKKTMDLVPTARVGESCFKSFWNGRTTPCEHCPLTGLSIENDYNTIEVYNDTLDVWTEATASLLPWVGEDNAALICCHDITRFKKG